jgi:hypothetical protein
MNTFLSSGIAELLGNRSLNWGGSFCLQAPKLASLLITLESRAG